jgi:flagellar biosynthesis protein FlhG
VADAYAHLKLTLPRANSARLWLIVNMADDELQSRSVYQRVRQSCERFLGHGIDWLGFVPHDPMVRDSARMPAPFVLVGPTSGAARAVQSIAAELVAGQRHHQPGNAA